MMLQTEPAWRGPWRLHELFTARNRSQFSQYHFVWRARGPPRGPSTPTPRQNATRGARGLAWRPRGASPRLSTRPAAARGDLHGAPRTIHISTPPPTPPPRPWRGAPFRMVALSGGHRGAARVPIGILGILEVVLVAVQGRRSGCALSRRHFCREKFAKGTSLRSTWLCG